VTNKQANILFIPSSIGGYIAESPGALSEQGYYQQLIYASLARSKYTIEGLQVLGEQLAAIARHAYFAKQTGAVEEVSQLMLGLPISAQLRSVARYYQALCAWRRGDADVAHQFERTIEEAPPQYRPRALQALGLAYHKGGELDAALPLYVAAGRAAADSDLLTLVYARSMTSVVRSIHGDHKRALVELEGLFPIVCAVGKYYPVLYYDVLNSLAIELAEVGRVREAQAACAITLASPFAPLHPNWRETRDEIAAKRVSATPSVVAVKRLPQPALSPKAARQHNAKPVIKFASSYPASDKDFFQRSALKIPATALIALNAVSILGRMQICIGPRAPPVFA
jgi:tetratricopeptide (TPR) repeat protein